jgi:hypothetical protein
MHERIKLLEEITKARTVMTVMTLYLEFILPWIDKKSTLGLTFLGVTTDRTTCNKDVVLLLREIGELVFHETQILQINVQHDCPYL